MLTRIAYRRIDSGELRDGILDYNSQTGSYDRSEKPDYELYWQPMGEVDNEELDKFLEGVRQNLPNDISNWPIEFLEERSICPCGATINLHINHAKGHEKRFDSHLIGQPPYTLENLKPCFYTGTPVP